MTTVNVANGDFSDGLDDWFTIGIIGVISSGTNTFVSNTIPAPIIDNCARLEPFGNQASLSQGSISAIAGKRCYLEFYTRTPPTPSESDSNTLSVEISGGAGINIPSTNTDNNWEFYSLEFTAASINSITFLSNSDTSLARDIANVSISYNEIATADFSSSSIWILQSVASPIGDPPIIKQGSSTNNPIQFRSYNGYLGFTEAGQRALQFPPATIGQDYQTSFWYKYNVSTTESLNGQIEIVDGQGSEIIPFSLAGTNTGTLDSPYTRFVLPTLYSPMNSTITFIFTLLSTPIDTLYIDDIQFAPPQIAPICFSPKSLVYVLDTVTNNTGYLKASETKSNRHCIWSVEEDKFVPIIYNIISNPTDHYIEITANSLGPNQPTDDLYITAGHEILLDGDDTKAANIPGATRIKVKPEIVYTLCTEKRCHTLINGLKVATFSKKGWHRLVSKRGLDWSYQ